MSYQGQFGRQSRQDCLSVCPPSLAHYAATNLDSIAKVVNHVLIITLICELCLFIASWSSSILKHVGINVVMISFLLCFQTVIVYCILNNTMIHNFPFLTASPMMVGVALGTTVGASILALIISNACSKLSKCAHITAYENDDEAFHDNNSNNHAAAPVNKFDDPICQYNSGSMTAVWFWSGLVFWFDFCTCLLLSIGQNELMQGRGQYESVPSTAHGYSVAGNGPAFVGDYATIPEIRSGGGNDGAVGISIGGQQMPQNPAHVQSV